MAKTIKMPQTPKPKAPELGQKKRSGQLLSSFLRAIAQEKDENGVSNAEAMARLIWKKSLGYKEKIEVDGEEVEVIHDPEVKMIELCYNRMEGKIANAEENQQRTQTLPEKVSEMNKDRLNKLASK